MVSEINSILYMLCGRLAYYGKAPMYLCLRTSIYKYVTLLTLKGFFTYVIHARCNIMNPFMFCEYA